MWWRQPEEWQANTNERDCKHEDSHFTAWVGRYEDLETGEENGYLVKLLHSHAGGDHTYPGLELLPDGTLVATTYIKYRPGKDRNSVVSTRFKLSETDAQIKAK